VFTYRRYKSIFFILVLIVCIQALRSSLADANRDMGGWEEGSAYNQLYNPKEMENFKAWEAFLDHASRRVGQGKSK
jgi:hypothetical protein